MTKEKIETEFADYKFCLEHRIKEKKVELFDKMFLHSHSPLGVSFVMPEIIKEYRQFYNESINNYLSVLKVRFPHEYERLVLSKKLLAFRSGKLWLLELLNEF